MEPAVTKTKSARLNTFNKFKDFNLELIAARLEGISVEITGLGGNASSAPSHNNLQEEDLEVDMQSMSD